MSSLQILSVLFSVTGVGYSDGAVGPAEHPRPGGPLGRAVCTRGGSARERSRPWGLHTRRAARRGDAGQPSRPHGGNTTHPRQGQAEKGNYLNCTNVTFMSWFIQRLVVEGWEGKLLKFENYRLKF